MMDDCGRKNLNRNNTERSLWKGTVPEVAERLSEAGSAVKERRFSAASVLRIVRASALVPLVVPREAFLRSL